MKNDGLKLATYSGLILFFELALIRYTAGYVHLFSFYLNFVLIATFLGMGVGGLVLGQGIVQAAYNNWKWPVMVSRQLNVGLVGLFVAGFRSSWPQNRFFRT